MASLENFKDKFLLRLNRLGEDGWLVRTSSLAFDYAVSEADVRSSLLRLAQEGVIWLANDDDTQVRPWNEWRNAGEMGRQVRVKLLPRGAEHNEEARQETLRQYEILDTDAEKVFDTLTAMAAAVCQTPISLLSFVDRDRQWFKSRVGLSIRETSRSLSFCAHAICGDDLFVVPDALIDERFAKNPLVTGDPNIRFYAGMPLISPQGYGLGTLCVIDHVPRELSEDQKTKLSVLAQSAMLLLEMRSGRPQPSADSEQAPSLAVA
jgi:GAF domain-containing protein